MSECSTNQELTFRLGYSYCNGRVWKKIAKLLSANNISVTHFNRHKSKRKYPIVEKRCPVCDIVFKTQVGNKQERVTCSVSCCNSFFAEKRYNKQSNEKRAKSLNDYHVSNGTAQVEIIKKCPYCDKDFPTFKNSQKFCSRSCNGKKKWEDESYRAYMKEKYDQYHQSEDFVGWTSRSKIKPSYPEQYTIDILEELDIKYVREYKIGRWFGDFVDVDRKLCLEIDGKQHNLPERKESDLRKDAYLKENGWTLLRIPWEKPSYQFRIDLVEKIKNFFQLQTSM